MIRKGALAVSLAVALAACSGGGGDTSSPFSEQGQPSQETDAAVVAGAADANKNPPAASKESSVNELQAHIPSGSKLLDSKIADLDGDGRPDALLVLDQGTGNEKLGEGAPRTLVLLVRDASGQLQAVGQNSKLIPCETCGGVSGDPYGYVRAEANRFTVAVGGGSRERWSDDYTFVRADGVWYADKVLRVVTDTETDAEKQKEFTATDFGKVRFEDFDPASLEQVTL